MNDKLNDGSDLPKEGKTGCELDRRKNLSYKVASLAGKTIAGAGVGIIMGIGVVAAAAVAEVVIPAVLTFKALGLTGGALGFLHGAKDFK